MDYQAIERDLLHKTVSCNEYLIKRSAVAYIDIYGESTDFFIFAGTEWGEYRKLAGPGDGGRAIYFTRINKTFSGKVEGIRTGVVLESWLYIREICNEMGKFVLNDEEPLVVCTCALVEHENKTHLVPLDGIEECSTYGLTFTMRKTTDEIKYITKE